MAPSNIDHKRNLPPGLARLVAQTSTSKTVEESILQVVYEVKPHDANVDYRYVI